MTYTFARIKAHPDCDQSGWCLVIPMEAFDLTQAMHKRVATAMALKFFKDPHLFQDGQPRREDSPFYHPIKLAAGWLNTALRGLAEHGVIYMNRATGLVFGSVEVLETRESEKLEFPIGENHKEGVRITISTWRGGDHYYLRASNNQLFSKEKYDSYAEAEYEARKYAFVKNITFMPGYRSFVEGD
jgi:hypothetical protein